MDEYTFKIRYRIIGKRIVVPNSLNEGRTALNDFIEWLQSDADINNND